VKLFSVNAYPTLVTIDREGRITNYVIGSRSEAKLRRIIDQVRKQ